jgi:hypothetical protein
LSLLWSFLVAYSHCASRVPLFVVLQEPLKVSYRPLFFYLALELAAGAKHLMLLAAGFVGHTYGSYTYYTYNLPTQQQAAHG